MDFLVNDIREKASQKSLRSLKNTIIDCSKNIKSNDNTFRISTLPTVTNKITESIGHYVDCVQRLEASNIAFQNIKDKVEILEDGDDEDYHEEEIYVKEFKEDLEKELQNLRHLERNAIDELNKIIRPPDDEIQVEAPSRQVLKDPITQMDIEVPVRSKVCKHVYEKSSIETYLLHKKKCPVAGCTNRTMKKDELVAL